MVINFIISNLFFTFAPNLRDYALMCNKPIVFCSERVHSRKWFDIGSILIRDNPDEERKKY